MAYTCNVDIWPAYYLIIVSLIAIEAFIYFSRVLHLVSCYHNVDNRWFNTLQFYVVKLYFTAYAVHFQFARNISTSFPFNKFSIILEYGGPSTSSKISSMSPTMDELPQLHFLEVKVDNQVFPMEFYEGYDVTLHLKSKMVISCLSYSWILAYLSNYITKFAAFHLLLSF